MNNEIKENVEPTLEYLKICVEDDILFETTNCKALLDYITNLQEENNILKRDNEALKKYYNNLVDYILPIENKDIYIEEKYDSED